MIKTVKEAKKILRKGKKYHAYNGDKKIGTTYAIDSARLLALNHGDRVIFKRDGEVITELVVYQRILGKLNHVCDII